MRKGLFAGSVLVALLSVALIQTGHIPRTTGVGATAEKKPFDCASMTFKDEGVSLPAELVGHEVIVAFGPDCKVTNLLEVARITPQGTQEVVLPVGQRFDGIAYHYRQSLSGGWVEADAGWRVTVHPRDKDAKPRTYTITIKEQ